MAIQQFHVHEPLPSSTFLQGRFAIRVSINNHRTCTRLRHTHRPRGDQSQSDLHAVLAIHTSQPRPETTEDWLCANTFCPQPRGFAMPKPAITSEYMVMSPIESRNVMRWRMLVGICRDARGTNGAVNIFEIADEFAEGACGFRGGY